MSKHLDQQTSTQIARWRIKLRTSKKSQKREIRFDHKKLQERTVNEAFRLELRNRFEILEDFQEPESLWQGFRESVHDFGKKKLVAKEEERRNGLATGHGF